MKKICIIANNGLENIIKDFINQQEIGRVVDKPEKCDVLIIQIEKIDSTSDENYTDFKGIKIAGELRLNGFDRPIIFTSLLELSDLKIDIPLLLETSAHEFLSIYDLEKLTDCLKKLKSLSPERLADIRKNLITRSGHLSEILHNLKNKSLLKKIKKGDVISLLSPYIPSFDWSKIPDELDYNEIERLEKEINTPRELPISLPKPEGNWKVLFIDDEKEIRERFKEKLESPGITCETADSAESAFKILDEDKNNSITVVISDYRLRDENGKWQEYQGYEILKEIALNKPRFVSLFALTAFSDDAIIEIQNKYHIKILSFPKSIMTNDSSFSYLLREIITEGNKTYDALCSIPDKKSWNEKSTKFSHPLKEFYKAYRMSENYEKYEGEINEKTKSLLASYESGQALKIKNITAALDLDKERKNNFENFKLKLLARRFTLAIYYQLINELIKEGYKEDINRKLEELKKDIYAKLTGNTGKDSAIKQLFDVHLALNPEDDFPFKILPEERAFLEDFIGRPVKDFINGANNLLLKFTEAICESAFTEGETTHGITFNNEEEAVNYINNNICRNQQKEQVLKLGAELLKEKNFYLIYKWSDLKKLKEIFKKYNPGLP